MIPPPSPSPKPKPSNGASWFFGSATRGIALVFLLAALASCQVIPAFLLPKQIADSTPAATQAVGAADQHDQTAENWGAAVTTQLRRAKNLLAAWVTTRPSDTQPMTEALDDALAKQQREAAEIGASRSANAAVLEQIAAMGRERTEILQAAAQQHAADAKVIADKDKQLAAKDREIAGYKNQVRQMLNFGAFACIGLGVALVVLSFFNVFGVSVAGVRPIGMALLVTGIALWGLVTYLGLIWWVLVAVAVLGAGGYVVTHWSQIEKDLTPAGAK